MSQEDPIRLQTEKFLREWADFSRTYSENQIVQGFLKCLPGSTTSIDTFSTWLLTVVGAGAALFISNFSSLAPNVSARGSRIALILLACSIASGFIQKYYALLAAIHIQASKDAFSMVKATLDEYSKTKDMIEEHARKMQVKVDTEIRLNRIFDEAEKTLPALVRWRFKKERSKLATVPYYSEGRVIRTVFRQSLCLGIQMIFVLAALIVFTIAIK